ncbi:MAG: extracellular solute-binding protein, partial [Propionibacteriaceae bacterium]|nr:extracellular solute-binding protein [Propionibacteriaceae bacterium]
QHQFYASGYTPARALPDDEVVAGFKDGTIPMFISGPYMTRSLADQAPELDGQWAIARIPAKASSTSLMAGSNIGIFAQSDNVAAAGAFLAFLAEAETQLRWNSLSNDLPAVADAMEELAASDPMAAVFFEQMQDAKPVPIISTWGQVSQEVLAANEQINVGGASVDEAVASLQQRVAGL